LKSLSYKIKQKETRNGKKEKENYAFIISDLFNQKLFWHFLLFVVAFLARGCNVDFLYI
jgi:hypothetical protein